MKALSIAPDAVSRKKMEETSRLSSLMFGFAVFVLIFCPRSSIAAEVDICDQCLGSANRGGPCYAGKGGPRDASVGGPCYAGVGGPRYAGMGGPRYAGKGGPLYAGKGGLRYAGRGGPCYAGKGGPCASKKGILNPDCPSICIGR